jgi:hypothetical protein
VCWRARGCLDLFGHDIRFYGPVGCHGQMYLNIEIIQWVANERFSFGRYLPTQV